MVSTKFHSVVWPVSIPRFNDPRARASGKAASWELTQLVFSAQRLAPSIPQRLRTFIALCPWRESYTIWLGDPPGWCHGAIEQLPQRRRDAMAVRAVSLTPL
jgi:hypothetical protein